MFRANVLQFNTRQPVLQTFNLDVLLYNKAALSGILLNHPRQFRPKTKGPTICLSVVCPGPMSCHQSFFPYQSGLSEYQSENSTCQEIRPELPVDRKTEWVQSPQAYPVVCVYKNPAPWSLQHSYTISDWRARISSEISQPKDKSSTKPLNHGQPC